LALLAAICASVAIYAHEFCSSGVPPAAKNHGKLLAAGKIKI
jgi:hypothetical protein